MRKFAGLPFLGALVGWGLVIAACGGSKPAETPPVVVRPVEPSPPPPLVEPEPEPAPKVEAPPLTEPEFKEGGSVDDAISAVPRDAERLNMDQETLSRPIQDYGVYEPCNPGNGHFTLRVAVWNGRVVGSDVTTTPKNDKLAACIKDRLKDLKWAARVKSLNTVEYSF